MTGVYKWIFLNWGCSYLYIRTEGAKGNPVKPRITFWRYATFLLLATSKSINGFAWVSGNCQSFERKYGLTDSAYDYIRPKTDSVVFSTRQTSVTTCDSHSINLNHASLINSFTMTFLLLNCFFCLFLWPQTVYFPRLQRTVSSVLDNSVNSMLWHSLTTHNKSKQLVSFCCLLSGCDPNYVSLRLKIKGDRKFSRVISFVLASNHTASSFTSSVSAMDIRQAVLDVQENCLSLLVFQIG